MGMIPKIVLTGGPCAGKTTCLRAIAQAFDGRIVTVPEAATLVLGSGFPAPGSNSVPCSEREWSIAFQETILSLQRHLEMQFSTLARKSRASLLLCDRGILDGAAYWHGGRDAFLGHFGLSLEQCHTEYHSVIHLESLAASHPHHYSKSGNEVRFEPVDEACQREQCIRNVWEDHPRWIFASGSETVEDKIDRVLEIVRGILDGGV